MAAKESVAAIEEKWRHRESGVAAWRRANNQRGISVNGSVASLAAKFTLPHTRTAHLCTLRTLLRYHNSCAPRIAALVRHACLTHACARRRICSLFLSRSRTRVAA
jgi:hypothetical protein